MLSYAGNGHLIEFLFGIPSGEKHLAIESKAIQVTAKNNIFSVLIIIDTDLQWDGSKVRKKTRVLFGLILVSTQEDHVPKAVLKAVPIDIPSFNELPIWK